MDYILDVGLGCLLGLGISAVLGTLAAILRDACTSDDPDEPPALQRIVARCLDAIRARGTRLVDQCTTAYRARTKRTRAHRLLTATPARFPYRLGTSATSRPGPAARPPIPTRRPPVSSRAGRG